MPYIKHIFIHFKLISITARRANHLPHIHTRRRVKFKRTVSLSLVSKIFNLCKSPLPLIRYAPTTEDKRPGIPSDRKIGRS